jgi:hypothetical protein
MLTRYVFLEGEVVGDPEAFRRTIDRELLPMWQKMPHNTGVRVTFAEERDDGAPEILMVLAVDYPDEEALKASLASDHRYRTRDLSAVVLKSCFAGRAHHHVMRSAS